MVGDTQQQQRSATAAHHLEISIPNSDIIRSGGNNGDGAIMDVISTSINPLDLSDLHDDDDNDLMVMSPTYNNQQQQDENYVQKSIIASAPSDVNSTSSHRGGGVGSFHCQDTDFLSSPVRCNRDNSILKPTSVLTPATHCCSITSVSLSPTSTTTASTTHVSASNYASIETNRNSMSISSRQEQHLRKGRIANSSKSFNLSKRPILPTPSPCRPSVKPMYAARLQQYQQHQQQIYHYPISKVMTPTKSKILGDTTATTTSTTNESELMPPPGIQRSHGGILPSCVTSQQQKLAPSSSADVIMDDESNKNNIFRPSPIVTSFTPSSSSLSPPPAATSSTSWGTVISNSSLSMMLTLPTSTSTTRRGDLRSVSRYEQQQHNYEGYDISVTNSNAKNKRTKQQQQNSSSDRFIPNRPDSNIHANLWDNLATTPARGNRGGNSNRYRAHNQNTNNRGAINSNNHSNTNTIMNYHNNNGASMNSNHHQYANPNGMPTTMPTATSASLDDDSLDGDSSTAANAAAAAAAAAGGGSSNGRNRNPSIHTFLANTQQSLVSTLLRSELMGDTIDHHNTGANGSNGRSASAPSTTTATAAAPQLATRRTLQFQREIMQENVLSGYRSTDASSSNIVTDFSLTPVGSVTSQKLMTALVPPRRKRKIAKIPFKVLDAPALQDDFYLNLVDWSSQNVLAVGLGSCVYLWSACTSKVTKLCDLSDARNNNRPDDNGDRTVDTISGVSWAQRGTHLAVGTSHGDVQLWDTISCTKIRTMDGHTARVGTLAWTGPILASGSRDRLVYLRDVRCATPFTDKLTHHRQEVCGLKWSHDDKPAFLASGGNDNALHVIDSRNPNDSLHAFTEHTAAVKAIAWSPHQHGLLASGGGTADRCIRFWNTLSGSSLHKIDTGSQVCNLAWSKNCNEFVSTHGYSYNQIVVWKYPSMSKVATLTGHTYRVLYLAMSPDGSTIVTGAGDETLRFWNVFPGPPTDTSNHSGGLLFPNTIGSVIR